MLHSGKNHRQSLQHPGNKACFCQHGRVSPDNWVQENAEQAVRSMLRAFSEQQGLAEQGSVTAVDHMDDGTPIALTVTIDRNDG